MAAEHSEYNGMIRTMMGAYDQDTPDELVGFDSGFPRADSQMLLNLARRVLDVTEELDGDPVRVLRVRLLAEEFAEYLEAEATDDVVETADALGDMKVIIEGTGLSYGMDMDAVDREIFASNMSKVDPVTGGVVKRADGKTLKPESYFRPDIRRALGIGSGE